LAERPNFINKLKEALQVSPEPEDSISSSPLTILDLIAGVPQNAVRNGPIEVDTVEELMGLPPPPNKQKSSNNI